MSMNPEVKAKWVAALRSGKYKQGRGALRDKHGHMCCLGVLCDLIAPGDWVAPAEDEPVNPEFFRHHGVLDTPAQDIRATAGFASDGEDDYYDTPKVSIEGNRDYLWSHNDSGRTFEEIAQAIEEQL